MRLLFDLLSSCSGLLKHAAAKRPAAVTVPTLTFNVRRVVRPGLDPCAVDAAQVAVTETALRSRRTTPPPSKTEVAAARGAVALAEGDAATPYRCC